MQYGTVLKSIKVQSKDMHFIYNIQHYVLPKQKKYIFVDMVSF